MKLILDEMYTPTIAVALADKGFDVVAVSAAPALRGTPDADLLSWVSAQQWAIFTENIADFMTIANQWVSEGRPHAGLILANPKKFNRAARAYPGDLIAALNEFLTDIPVQGESWIWWL